MRIHTINVLFITCGVLYANLPENPEEYETWETKMLGAVASQKSQPPENAIPKLADWVSQLSVPNTPNWEKGERPVFHAAQASLLSIPGHAEYFRDRINEAREKMDAINPDENSALWNHQRNLWKSAMSGFGVMANLPSVESVSVLGAFLADERGKTPYPPMPHKGEPDEKFAEWHQNLDSWAASWPHSHYAMLALHRLPIVGKPFKGALTVGSPDVPEIEDAVTAWRQWHQEIKDGKRTFRFEGDSTEYDLNGPAPKEKLERIALNGRMESDREARQGRKDTPGVGNVAAPAEKTIAGKSNAYIITAGLALLAGVVWYIIGTKRGHAP